MIFEKWTDFTHYCHGTYEIYYQNCPNDTDLSSWPSLTLLKVWILLGGDNTVWMQLIPDEVHPYYDGNLNEPMNCKGKSWMEWKRGKTFTKLYKPTTTHLSFFYYTNILYY